MPTLATYLQLLPKQFRGSRYRSTDGTVFFVVEGSGRARIGQEMFSFGPRDTFVVPSWTLLALEADDEAVLFSFSDRPVQEALGLLRVERLAAA